MKKAFTLIELLAVIVILAIILVIAVPMVLKTIANAKKGAIESDVKLIIDAIEKKVAVDDTFIYTDIKESNIEEKLGLKNTNYKSIEVTEVDGRPSVVIEGQNKYDGYTAYGTYTSVEVVPSDEYVEEETGPSVYVESEGVNKPSLATGMTAIKWNGSTWEDVTNPDTDTSWYDYANKQWANARTADGSMWVWIPRYIYKISSGWHTNTTGTINIQFTKDTNDNWNSAVIGNIDTGTTANASNNKWTNHPAFTFGTAELTGMWMAKFEPSGTSDAIDIKPNLMSFADVIVSDMFSIARNMETNSRYGWGTSGNNIDTHMMKNIEWGAVAYLSKSIYGKDADEVWMNPSDDEITGCAGDSVWSEPTTTCLRTYDTANGQQASTTGNIYGVYDMSAGSQEFVAAYVDNGNSSLTTYGNNIINADIKYKDVYSVTTDTDVNNYANAINKKGDAVYETSSSHTGSNSWFGDYSRIGFGNYPFLRRGTYYMFGAAGGGAASGVFALHYTDGSTWHGRDTFRPVLLVNQGL